MKSIGRLGVGKTEPYQYNGNCDRCLAIKPLARLVRSFYTLNVCRDCRQIITGVVDRRGLSPIATASATIADPPALAPVSGLAGSSPPSRCDSRFTLLGGVGSREVPIILFTIRRGKKSRHVRADRFLRDFIPFDPMEDQA